MGVNLAGGATSGVALLLDDVSANPVGLRAGRIQGTTTNALLHADGSWTGSLANPAAPWAVRITSGRASGALLDITANTATSLTVAAASLADLGVASGDSFELVALDTLGTLFGSTTLLSGPTPATADVVQVRSGTVWVSYFLDSTRGYWRRSSGLISNCDNTVIRPGTGLLVTRRGSAMPLVFTGRVLGGQFRFPVSNAGSTVLSQGFPTDTTLSGLAVQGLLPGWRAGTSVSAADSLALFNGSTWTPYVFNGRSWQTPAGVNCDNVTVPADALLLIQRPGTKPGTTDLLRPSSIVTP
jgi:hypothetical protein